MHSEVVCLVHLLSEPAFLTSGAGEILVANAAAAHVTGLAQLALIGFPISSLVADPASKISDYLRLCSRSRQLLPGSVTLLPKDQPPLEVRCDGAVLTPKTESSPAVLFLRCRPRNETTVSSRC